MHDAELRSALFQFFKDQQEQCDRIVTRLESAKDNLETEHKIEDLLDWQMNYLQHVQRATRRLLEHLQNNGADADYSVMEASVSTESEAQEMPSLLQDWVAAYNESPGNWIRKFRSASFGAENVNEMWGRGGEPKFARKEGGIYQLIEADGVCYVFPEPGLRLQESYKRSEGLDYLFEVDADLAEAAKIFLIRPAALEESNGRWSVLHKGELRGQP